MIGTTAASRTALPRPARAVVALVGVVGIATLVGCASPAGDSPADASTQQPPTGATATGTTPPGSGAGGAYADGTYTAEGSYATPESVEKIEVTITLESDRIAAVEVTGRPQAAESQRYQAQFIGGISDEVVGRRVDEVSVSRVAGSSLTSAGFTQALQQIASEAAA